MNVLQFQDVFVDMEIPKLQSQGIEKRVFDFLVIELHAFFVLEVPVKLDVDFNEYFAEE